MANSDTTIAAIFSAAEKLFVEKNYADVSMRDIAQAADVSTGALYHHFPSKDKLYAEMLIAYMERIRTLTLNAIPAQDTCRERLRALTRVFLALRPAQRNVMRLLRRDVNAFKGRTRENMVRAYQSAVPDLVEQVLADAIKRGEIKKQDTRWLAWAYVALVETTLSEYAQQKLGNLDARLNAVLDLFLDGTSL